MNTIAISLHIILTSPLATADFLKANTIEGNTGCSGTLKAYQSETGIEQRFRESSVNTRSNHFVRSYKVRLRAEGNCCWKIHSRKKFKGATLELRQSDGVLEVRASKVKSVRLVGCHTFNRAGGGLPGLLAGVVLVILVSAGLILHRRYRRYRPVTNVTPDLTTPTMQN